MYGRLVLDDGSAENCPYGSNHGNRIDCTAANRLDDFILPSDLDLQDYDLDRPGYTRTHFSQMPMRHTLGQDVKIYNNVF